MADIDLEQLLIELINGAVSDENDQVSSIISVGATDSGTTIGLYRTKGGRELGFEIADGSIQVFEIAQ